MDLLWSLHSKEEIPHVWKYLRVRTKNLVEVNWFVIQHLAKELLRLDTMTGNQVEVAIREGYRRDFQRRTTTNKTKGVRQ